VGLYLSVLKSVKAMMGDNFSKGEIFEEYVAGLFPEKFFSIMHKTTNKSDLNGRKIESSLKPDFQFRHLPNNHCFWVECKFRSDIYQDKIEWCKEWQFNRYKQFQESVRPEKIFVVIGLGGRWSNPEALYCMPLDEINYPGLFPKSIGKYRRPVDKEFWYQAGKLY
jgi:hypothetical protein